MAYFRPEFLSLFEREHTSSLVDFSFDSVTESIGLDGYPNHSPRRGLQFEGHVDFHDAMGGNRIDRFLLTFGVSDNREGLEKNLMMMMEQAEIEPGLPPFPFIGLMSFLSASADDPTFPGKGYIDCQIALPTGTLSMMIDSARSALINPALTIRAHGKIVQMLDLSFGESILFLESFSLKIATRDRGPQHSPDSES